MTRNLKGLLVIAGCFTLFILAGFTVFSILYTISGQEVKHLRLASRETPPDMTQASLFRPSFNTEYGPIVAGTAFLASDLSSGKVWLLSAHHLLGQAGGLPQDLNWDEVAENVHGVTCEPIDEGSEMIQLDQIVTIEGAASMDDNTGRNDLLAFRAR